MTTIDRKLREVRKRLGLKQGELADAIGVSQGTISRWESGVQEPDFKALMKVAELANINSWDFLRDDHTFLTSDNAQEYSVVAGIAQNVWVEGSEWLSSEQFRVRLPTPKDWQFLQLKGFVIQDQSCDPYYPRESVVFIATNGLSKPEHEDHVVVLREDERGLFEITLKEYYINQRNQVYLSTISDDPEINSPLRIPTGDSDNDTIPAISPSSILGVVVASVQFMHRHRFKAQHEEQKSF